MNWNNREYRPNKPGKGCRRFIFGYEDLAELFGISVAGVKTARVRGHFDPTCLKSIIDYYNRRNRVDQG